MLIIVEGPDGAGKTTFVNSLKKLLRNAEILHFGPPKQWPVSEYELAVQDYAPGSGENLICDRLHVGELIYGPIYRSESKLTPAGLTHVNALLSRQGAVIVYLDQPDDVLIERVAERGDDFIDINHLTAIAEAYRSYTQRDSVRHLVNPTREMTIALAGAIETQARELSSLKSYVGSLRPKILFVGDVKSGMAGGHKQAFVPWPGRSGEMLMNAINELQLPSWGVLNQADDDVEDAEFVLEPTTVVALGQHASDALKRKNIRHVTTHHPANVQRFHAGESYVDYLRKALV